MPVDPFLPPETSHDARVADRLAALERQMRGILQFLQGGAVQQVPVVATLPTAGRKGRLMMLSTTNKLWRDDGTNWVLESP